jgi:hypothetical protein
MIANTSVPSSIPPIEITRRDEVPVDPEAELERQLNAHHRREREGVQTEPNHVITDPSSTKFLWQC